MKNLYITILMAIVCSGIAMAQDGYRPFVEEGKTWHMYHEVDNFPEYNYDFDFIIQGDTLIGGTEAKKVYGINEGNGGVTVYKMALREADRKVFFIPPGSEQQYVLYDFNGRAGDEVTIAKEIKENPDNIAMKIIADQTIRIHDIDRRAYLVMRAEDEVIDWSCCGWWIEGIGSTLGPFNAWRFGYTGMFNGMVDCEVNGQIVYEGVDWMHLDDEYWKGDMNSDGIFDIDDVNAVINIILKVNVNGDYPGNGDLNGDGVLDIDDVNILINKILKLD